MQIPVEFTGYSQSELEDLERKGYVSFTGKIPTDSIKKVIKGIANNDVLTAIAKVWTPISVVITLKNEKDKKELKEKYEKDTLDKQKAKVAQSAHFEK